MADLICPVVERTMRFGSRSDNVKYIGVCEWCGEAVTTGNEYCYDEDGDLFCCEDCWEDCCVDRGVSA